MCLLLVAGRGSYAAALPWEPPRRIEVHATLLTGTGEKLNLPMAVDAVLAICDEANG